MSQEWNISRSTLVGYYYYLKRKRENSNEYLYDHRARQLGARILLDAGMLSVRRFIERGSLVPSCWRPFPRPRQDPRSDAVAVDGRASIFGSQGPRWACAQPQLRSKRPAARTHARSRPRLKSAAARPARHSALGRGPFTPSRRREAPRRPGKNGGSNRPDAPQKRIGSSDRCRPRSGPRQVSRRAERGSDAASAGGKRVLFRWFGRWRNWLVW